MRFLFSALLIVFFSGCSWIRDLRDDFHADDDNVIKATDVDMNFYKDPSNRSLPPPPATALDNRLAPVAGTPVDLSGIRAKSGRVTRDTFYQESVSNENSLWKEDGQTNYLFARNQLKAPGDLVTVVIENDFRKDMVGEVKKLLPPEYRDNEIRVPGLTKEVTKDSKRALASAQQAQSGELDAYDQVTAEVLERYPNGNLRIRGVKRIPFKHQVRTLEFNSIVRGSDIDEKDTIKSSKFLEHRVELYR